MDAIECIKELIENDKLLLLFQSFMGTVCVEVNRVDQPKKLNPQTKSMKWSWKKGKVCNRQQEKEFEMIK